ncbi:MFS transporter [Streptomyces sp. NBC_00249]|uniref:MFS transporter n=1 Tax=Streptomyces sp. NBC_00249 TaxID=2975690 RepID=UPI00224FB137|nr:MFS transporter [Streptomyces sp. NBC_00249]MCX5195237.1 MFS transporter [Streptomyces sp. NBC_00249]
MTGLLRDLRPPAGVVRVLAVSNLARTVANGFLLSVSVLFFMRAVGIDAGRVGLGLTVAAVLAMLVSIPAGQLSDRLGSRNASVLFGAAQGMAVCCYALTGGFTGFLVVAALSAMADAGGAAARGALIAEAVPPAERVRARAYLQSVINVGLAVGTLLGGLALAGDSGALYRWLLAGAGLLFTAAALLCLRLPRTKLPVPDGSTGARRHVLRDGPFVAVSALNAVLVLGTDALLTVALPIWITERTDAPVSLFAGLVFVNTAMCVLFQVRMSKGAEDVTGGARAMRRSGILLALCCACFALSAGQPAWVAGVCLVVGAVVHVCGEMLHSAGSWALSYELAPPDAHGQYQGMFNLAQRVGGAVTPLLTTAVIIGWGMPGWLLFGGLLLAGGLATPAVARWAARTRPFPAAGAPTTEPPADGATAPQPTGAATA